MLLRYIALFTFFFGFILYAENETYSIKFDAGNIKEIKDFNYSGNAGMFIPDFDNLLNSKVEIIFAINDANTFDFEIIKSAALDSSFISYSKEYAKNDIFETIDLGIYRGVKLKKVIIRPIYFNYKNNSFELISDAKLYHQFNLSSKRQNISLRNYEFIQNVSHVPYLIHYSEKQQFLGNYNALDMNNDYLKIITKSDRIYKIPLSEIFNYLPDLNGKSKEKIRLMNRGSDVKFFIRSSDNLLSSDDFLYFYGKHRRSDSTYYSFYGIEESYFLFYDENYDNKQYIQSDIQGNYRELETVRATYHYERDSSYFYYNLDTEQYDNEGWYWGEVYPDEAFNAKSEFSPKLFVSPSENLNDDIRIKVFYKSYQDIAFNNPVTKHTYDLDLIINNNTYDNEIFEGFKHGFLDAYLNNESLIYGLNEIKIKANVRNAQTDNYTGIDYIEVSGDMKPQAVNGRLNFAYVSDKISGVKIPNFSNSEVVAVNQNEIFFPDLIQGVNFNIGAIANRGASVGINDDFMYVSEPGIYFMSYTSDNVIRLSSDDGENAIINAMNNLPDNTPFVFVAYQVSSINSFNSILKDFDAISYSDYKAGDIYAFAGIKGSQNKVEQINSDLININQFFENSNSDFGSAEFNVPSIYIGSFFISNIAENNDYELISVSNNNLYETQDVDYLIITHKDFEEGIKKLADFRKDRMGVNYKIVNTEDVYNQFGDGIKSPFAIKNFIDYVYHNYQEPKVSDILLVGDASWDPRKNLKLSIAENFLPSYGMPVSDFWYVTVDGDDLLPDINIGRLSVNDNSELDNIISKLITHDTVPVKSWMKEMLFLSGGITEDEIRRFKNRIPYVKDDILEPAPLGGKGTSIIRSAASASGEENAGEIRREINEGKFWTNFLGHASSEIFDMDGWQVETLNNNKRFGILSTLSCNTGAFAEPPLKSSRNETYIKAKDKGFVATVSGTATGYVQYQWVMLELMAKAFADSNLRYRKIGDLLSYAKVRMANPLDPFNKHTLYQMTILGDPLTSLRLDDNTDLFLDGNEISYSNELGAVIFSEDNETIHITGFVNNNGYCTDEKVVLKVIRNVDSHNYSDTVSIEYEGICFNREFDIELPVLNMDGEHKIELIVDPDEVVNDTKRYNNTFSILVNVLSQSLIVLEPKDAGIINRDEPVFRILDPLNNNKDDINYEFYISESKNSNDYIISSETNEIVINSTHIDWTPDVSNLEVGRNYWFKAGYNTNGSIAKWTYTNFTIADGVISEGVQWMISTSEQFNEFINQESKNIDILEFDKVTLNSDTIPYKMISFIGDRTVVPNIKTWIDIEIGDDVYSVGEFWRGFHVVTLPVDISKGRGKHRRFDTWGNDDSFGEEFWKDSSAVKFVEFLEDSVRDDEYLFVSSSHSSFRLFRKHYFEQPESKGNLDSLVKVLKLYGATLSDSLNKHDIIRTDDATYQLVSRLGYDKPIEKLIFTKDSLMVIDKIIRHNLSANAVTELIGPATKWEDLQMVTEHTENQSFVVKVIGVNSDSEDTIIVSENQDELNLNNIDAGIYPNLKISVELFVNNIEFSGFDEIKKPKLLEMKLNYIPKPEIAVIPESISISKDSVLTGEPLSVIYALRNLSLRSNANETEYKIWANKEKGETFYENYHRIPVFLEDSIIHNVMNIATEDIDLKNKVYGDLSSSNDIYIFNNTFNTGFSQIIDNVKPYIRIKSDGKYISNGDYIAAKPTIEIELYDNAFMNITDSTKISARLNGSFHPGNRTEFADFKTIEDSTLKAVLTFRPDTIEYEDILLFAYVADAANNRDTLRLNLKTTLRNSNIENVLSVPNPFSDETEIDFILKTPKSEADAEIYIYDVIGNLIKIINSKVSPGRNSIRWDGKMSNGADVPLGMYYFKINILNAGYVEPAHGKVVKVE
jgi:hypothetical protein